MIPNFNPPNFEPPAQGVDIKSFGDLRDAVAKIRQWIQYVTQFHQNTLLPVLNTQNFGYGSDLKSATAINPTAQVHNITGAAPIDTINASANAVGTFYGIAQDGFTTTTTGNIMQAVTVPAGHMAVFAYHPVNQKWGVVTS